MEPKIIGLSAQLQNGKDTVAALILKLTSKESPYSAWTTRRFAGKLKEMTAILLGCTIDQLEDINYKNTELSEDWRRWYFTHYKLKTETNPEGRVSPYFSNEKDALEYKVKLEDINYKNTELSEDWRRWYFTHYKLKTETNPEGRVSPYFSNEKDALEYKVKLDDYVHGSQMENELLTPRKILQLLGTEGGRDVIHPNIWVNATLGDLTENDRIIITDARFPNEVIGIKKKKGIVVKIIRPSVVSTSTHPSETSLNNYTDWDYVIVNDGTLEQLEEKVERMLRHFNII